MGDGFNQPDEIGNIPSQAVFHLFNVEDMFIKTLWFLVRLICVMAVWLIFHSSLICCYHMSGVVRKGIFCLGENKGTDQLRSNCEANQRLCFRYTDSKIYLLSKSKISTL